MDAGKLPVDLLARLLSGTAQPDPRVLQGPSVGADAAVIDVGDRLLIAKADPVTFATDRIGWYAVQVNANDVACMGGTPRWFLATVLLPEGAPESLAVAVHEQITAACDAIGVTLVGGHTEVTYGLTRPIVSGQMLGEATRDTVVWPGGARPGDALILTQGIAIEGTSVLAHETADALLAAGMTQAEVSAAASLLDAPGISVVRAAHAAVRAGVTAMHDPTEGGLATGLSELAAAAKAGLEVDGAAVRVLPETSAVCRALDLDPLGLLASGSLLAAAVPERAEAVLAALAAEGIPAAIIGRVTEASAGLRLRTPDGLCDLPGYPRDELARYLSRAS
ncbi:MAG: AIR synthase-related protein [Chloroflexota bacterium]|nr:AIR synthase-related protein [Chloroflexota bacterium]